MIEFLVGIFAVVHVDREKVGGLLCCDLNKWIRYFGSTAGFDAVIHQVKEDAAEIAGFDI